MNREVWFNGRLIEEIIDNGDGTGTRIKFDETGEMISSEAVSDLPIDENIEETPTEPVIAPDAALRMREAFDSVATGSLTVSKLKLAMQAAIDALGTPS